MEKLNAVLDYGQGILGVYHPGCKRSWPPVKGDQMYMIPTRRLPAGHRAVNIMTSGDHVVYEQGENGMEWRIMLPANEVFNYEAHFNESDEERHDADVPGPTLERKRARHDPVPEGSERSRNPGRGPTPNAPTAEHHENPGDATRGAYMVARVADSEGDGPRMEFCGMMSSASHESRTMSSGDALHGQLSRLKQRLALVDDSLRHGHHARMGRQQAQGRGGHRQAQLFGARPTSQGMAMQWQAPWGTLPVEPVRCMAELHTMRSEASLQGTRARPWWLQDRASQILRWW